MREGEEEDEEEEEEEEEEQEEKEFFGFVLERVEGVKRRPGRPEEEETEGGVDGCC